MAIKIPGKRFGKRLQHSKVFGHHGLMSKKSIYADLLVTPLVDMFVIIVLFLIANFSATGEILNMSKDIQLPSAANVEEMQLAPVVLVSSEQVSVDGTIIGRVSDLVAEDYLNIPNLEEKLREMKRRNEDLLEKANNGEKFKGQLNIQAHKEVTFKIIKKVMFTAATAGFENINFATLNSGTGDTAEKAAPVEKAANPDRKSVV